MIPYGHQNISEEDINTVNAVLRSDWLTQGPMVTSFENAVANYCNAKYGVAFCNATAALHLACLALDVGPGDYVWTSPNTFVASANCALYCGASVDFVDIDPHTYNMSVTALRAKLEQAKPLGKLPKVVIPVHFSGQSCDMQAIQKLAQQYKFKVLEDAAHAIGANYRGAKVGSCNFSDIAIFSFHPVKVITTGEGGMAVTNDAELFKKLKVLVTHGITRDTSMMVGVSQGPWYYQQVNLGYNYRLTDFQCALGLSQLKRIDQFVKQRHELADRYNIGLANLPLVLPYQHPDNYSAYHLYVIQLMLDKLKKSRLQIFNELRAANIGVNVHYIPVHTQPFYRNLGFKEGDFPIAENYYAGAITLPLFPDLTFAQQDFVINKIKEVVQ